MTYVNDLDLILDYGDLNPEPNQTERLNHRIRLISYQNWKYSQPTDDLGGNGKNIPK